MWVYLSWKGPSVGERMPPGRVPRRDTMIRGTRTPAAWLPCGLKTQRLMAFAWRDIVCLQRISNEQSLPLPPSLPPSLIPRHVFPEEKPPGLRLRRGGGRRRHACVCYLPRETRERSASPHTRMPFLVQMFTSVFLLVLTTENSKEYLIYL